MADQNILSRFWNSNSRRAKLARIAALGIFLSTLALIANGVIVGLAMYSVSKNVVKKLVFSKVKVEGLSEEMATIETSGKVKSRLLALFKITFDKPLTAQVSVPTLASDELLSLEIPSFSIGKDVKEFNFSGENAAKMSFGSKFRVMNKDGESTLQKFRKAAQVRIKVKVSGSTNSFWFPVSFEREFIIIQTLQVEKSSLSSEGVGLKNVKLSDDSNPNVVQVSLYFEMPQAMIPRYLEVELPELFFHLSYKKNGNRGLLADLKLASKVFDKEENTVQFVVKVDKRYKEHLMKVLEDVKNGVEDFAISVSGAPQFCSSTEADCKTPKGMQRLLSAVELSEPYKSIVAQMKSQKSSNNYHLTLKHPCSPEIGFLGLVKVSQKVGANFIFEAGISKQFVSDVLGYDMKMIEGVLPPISLKNVVEYQNSLKNSVIARMEIRHLDASFSPTAQESCFHFEISVEVFDTVAASSLLAFFANKGLRQVTGNELKSLFKRLYITGEEDNLISSIASVYKLELPLADDSDDDSSDSWDIRGYSFSMPKAHEPAAHVMDIAVKDAKKKFQLYVNVEFQEKPIISNPTIRFYWDDVALSVASRMCNNLLKLNLSKGYFHVSLAPTNPLLLLQKGGISASLDIEDSPQLLNGWKFLADAFVAGKSSDELALIATMRGDEVRMLLPLNALLSIRGSTDLSNSISKNTQVRIRGFRDSTLNLLARIAPLNPVSPKKYKIVFRAAIPELHANVCMLEGTPEECCDVAKIWLDPLVVSGTVTDNSLSSIRFLSHFGEEESEWLPLSISVIKFIKLIEVIDKATSNDETISLSVAKQVSVDNTLLNKFFAHVGSSASFVVPKTPPQVAKTVRQPIESFTSIPATLLLDLDSPMWSQSETFQKLDVNATLRLPQISGNNNDNTAGLRSDSISLQWGRIEIEFIILESHLKLEIEKGFVTLRGNVGSGIGCSDEFRVKAGIKIPKEYTTYELRAALNAILAYVRGIVSKVPYSELINVKAVVDGKEGSNPYLLDSHIHVETLLKALKIIMNRAKSKHLPFDGFWDSWSAAIRMRSPPGKPEVTIPCFIPSMCHNGLLDLASHKDFIGVILADISQVLQLIVETCTSYVARAIQKVDLKNHPRSLVVETKLSNDIVIHGAVNDIDIAIGIVPKEQLCLKFETTLIYPEEYENNEELVEQQMKSIREDVRHFSISLKLAEHFHDASGIIKHVNVDPMFYITMDPIPKELPSAQYSTLSFSGTTERLEDSNLLSSLAGLIIGDCESGNIKSRYKPSGAINEEPRQSDTRVSIMLRNLEFTNPSNHFDFIVEEGLIGGYGMKRVHPRSTDPSDGFLVGYGCILPVGGDKFPILFQHNVKNTMDFEAVVAYDADGLNPKNSDDVKIVTKFWKDLISGHPLSVVLRLNFLPHYAMRMPMSFPKRPFLVPEISSSALRMRAQLFAGKIIGKIMNLKYSLVDAASSAKQSVSGDGKPDLSRTRVFWSMSHSGIIGTENSFIIVFVNKDGCRINKTLPNIQVKLVLVDSKNPRVRGQKNYIFRESIMCSVKPITSPGIYQVNFRPMLPGRYAISILLNHVNNWELVDWNFIYVRNLW